MGWEDVNLSEDEKPRKREYVEGTCIVQNTGCRDCRPCPSHCPIEAKHHECHHPPNGPYYMMNSNEPDVMTKIESP